MAKKGYWVGFTNCYCVTCEFPQFALAVEGRHIATYTFGTLKKLEGDVPIAQRANLAGLEAASEVQITLEVQHTDV